MLKKILVALLTVLILTACSNKEASDYEYSFTGESDNWMGEYYVQGTEVRGKRIIVSHIRTMPTTPLSSNTKAPWRNCLLRKRLNIPIEQIRVVVLRIWSLVNLQQKLYLRVVDVQLVQK